MAVGDYLALLIMRAMIFGVRRFDTIQSQLAASSLVISTRFKRQEKDSVIDHRPYPTKPERQEFSAPAIGRALDPTLLTLRS